MTTRTGNTYARRLPGPESTGQVLLRDECGKLILERLRVWHRLRARCSAARLDRELATGVSPESSAVLAARAAQLTSTKVRRELATSLRRILSAAGAPPDATVITARPVRLPLARPQIRAVAGPLAALAACLTAPGPLRAQGVAMVCQLLADGAGPLYRKDSAQDLGDVVGDVARALAL